MASGLKFTYHFVSGEFSKAMLEIDRPIAEAATQTMIEVGDVVKRQGRAEIAAAGFSQAWQNAFRVDVYPKEGADPSVNAAAFIWHKIFYAGVFAKGATITGKPFLWLPLPSTPKRIGRNKITPELYWNKIGKLALVERPGKAPLLVAKVKVPSTRITNSVSLSLLRRGTKAKRGVITSIPIFFGIKLSSIPKKFDIEKVVKRASQKLVQLYLQNFRSE